ncbi:DUF1127 domain-containing protein [Planktomarina sp.]|jgi:uncharacterized protein YjiS (DUF1127 family)|nr:DUF1127 domain-containing protein [Planktomarina sp.]
MTTLTMAADSIGLPGLANWFKKINAKMAHRAKVKQTIRELSRLSTHELNDIGIAPGDIYNIANGDETLKLSVNKNLQGWV